RARHDARRGDLIDPDDAQAHRADRYLAQRVHEAAMKKKLAFGVAFAIAAVVAWACGDQAVVTCHDIPNGGCPVQGGVECQDPTCAAAYKCNQEDGGWTLAHTCPGYDGSVQDTGIDAPPPNDAGY